MTIKELEELLPNITDTKVKQDVEYVLKYAVDIIYYTDCIKYIQNIVSTTK